MLVASTTKIRVSFSLASLHDLIVHQIYVKIIFLNIDLGDKINMEKLEGYVLPSNEQKVCNLVKSF